MVEYFNLMIIYLLLNKKAEKYAFLMKKAKNKKQK